MTATGSDRAKSWLRIFATLFAACALLLIRSTITSAATSSTDLSELSLEQLMDIEIVSASKQPERMSEAPASVFVITQEDIRRYGYRTLSEALCRVVGLYVSSDRNYTYLGVRGFARPGDYNTRLLLLIDGHRLNEPTYSFAFIGEELSLDIESIQRIEVVKGPGSALWGTNALLAIVNLITKKGSDIEAPSFTMEYGSESRRKIYVEYGAVSHGKLEVAASVSGIDSSGQHSIYFKEFDDPSTNNGVAVDLDGEAAARGYLAMSYKGLSFLVSSSRRKKTVPTAAWGALFGQPTFSVDGRSLAEISYEGDVLSSLGGRLLVRAYHDKYDYHSLNPYGDNPSTVVINRDSGSARWFGSEVRLGLDVSSRLSATIGWERQNVYKVQLDNHDVEPYYLYFMSDSSFSVSSYYLQVKLRAHKSLQLVGGTRLDDYSTFGRDWSPRCALIYTPTSKNTFKLLQGRAFRAPSVYELVYEQPVAGHIKSSNLLPEQIDTKEFVWEHNLSNSTRLITSLYEFDLDRVVELLENPDGSVQYKNAGHATSKGFEFQVESRLSNGATGYFGFSTVKARDGSTGEWLSNSPRHLANGGVSLPLWSGKMYLNPEVCYVGSRKTLAGNRVPSYVVANLTVTTGRAFGNTDASLGVYNLCNRTVYTPGSAQHRQEGIPQDGRTIRFQISRRF